MRGGIEPGAARGGQRVRGTGVAAVLALAATLAASLVLGGVAAADEDDHERGTNIFRPFETPTGKVQSFTTDPTLNRRNAFFDPSLGTNGQACVTCHEPSQGFGLSVEFIRDRFEATGGRDPLFRANDTADRPDANVFTLAARRNAFRLFLDTGVVRIALPVPASASFTVDPQNTPEFGPLPHPADGTFDAGRLSLFRRPLVNTNVQLDSAVLWDGRADIHNMRAQVKAAARALLASRPDQVTDARADNVAAFMLGVFTANVFDDEAGNLTARGAQGGPRNLAQQTPCTPLLPPPGCTPTGTFTLFDPWANLGAAGDEGRNRARAAVARGQRLFNAVNLNFQVLPGVVVQVQGCVACHDAKNVGVNQSPQFFVPLGLANPPDFFVGGIGFAGKPMNLPRFKERISKLPLYTFRQLDATGNPTGGTLQLTDPGRGLITGSFFELGAFKAPDLHDLTARGPFFHNGVAETLDDLVDFYNNNFDIGLTPDQHHGLVAFLRSL